MRLLANGGKLPYNMVSEKGKLTVWPQHLTMKIVRKPGMPTKDTLTEDISLLKKSLEAAAPIVRTGLGYLGFLSSLGGLLMINLRTRTNGIFKRFDISGSYERQMPLVAGPRYQTIHSKG